MNFIIYDFESTLELMIIIPLLLLGFYFLKHVITFFIWTRVDEQDGIVNGKIITVFYYIMENARKDLDEETAFIVCCQYFYLICIAALYCFHVFSDSLLTALRTTNNPSYIKNLQALLVWTFIFACPIIMIPYLWSCYPVSTWLLGITLFNIEIITKMLVTLSVYLLLLIDDNFTTAWEKLSDYVYFVKVFGNTVEFCLGIFLFLNALYITVFECERYIIFNVLLVCPYIFKIWSDIEGTIKQCREYIKCYSIVKKIEFLPDATCKQLAKYNDICAICYDDLKSAKITNCNHYFHSICLRRCVYECSTFQNRCPLCQTLFIKT